MPEGADLAFELAMVADSEESSAVAMRSSSRVSPCFCSMPSRIGVQVDRAKVELGVAEERVVPSLVGAEADDAHPIPQDDGVPVAGEPDDLVVRRFEVLGSGG